MSKLLVKILSVCAFVVLIPLIVVGSALCVTEARAVTLTIYQAGTERPETVSGLDVTSPDLAIYIDDVKQVDSDGNALTSVTVQKNTEVEVRLENYAAYTFAGWYKGNIQDPTSVGEASFTGAEYTFTIRGNTALTAIRNIKTYNITYSGAYDNGDPMDIDPANTTVYYNQALASIAGKAGAEFGGWYISNISDSTDSQPTMYANWSEVTGVENSYVLNPYWSNMMTFEYYDSDRTTLIAREYVSEANLSGYQLIAADDSRVTQALTSGYTFAGWVDESGLPVDLSQVEFTPSAYKIYLSENIIDYTVNVKFNAISDQIDTISYNVRDGFGLYNVQRDGYTFVGFEYNGITYTASGNDYVSGNASLGNVVVNASESITITAVWDCIYPDVAWSINFQYIGEGGDVGFIYPSNTATEPIEHIDDTILYIEDGDGFIQLENTIYNFVTSADIDNLYTYIEGEYVKVEFDYVDISVNAGNVSTEFGESLNPTEITFDDILYQIYDNPDGAFAGFEDNEINDIQIVFVFKLAPTTAE